MALSVRTRFEVFKRDDFTCGYCGRRTPEVVLEVDHIVPSAGGGTDDVINLLTSCWECNRGKSDVPLNKVLTAEDPHDAAILILERERQLAEYNAALAADRDRREEDAWELWRYWQWEQGNRSKEELDVAPSREIRWLITALRYCPKEKVREFMDLALLKGLTKGLPYVNACVRNWRYRKQAVTDMAALDDL